MKPLANSASQDIEDSGRYLTRLLPVQRRPSPSSYSNLPLTFEVSVGRAGVFLSDDDLDAQILALTGEIPPGQSFFLRIVGGLISSLSSLQVFNEKILRLVNFSSSAALGNSSASISALALTLKNCQFLIDLSYERLIDLIPLPSSVLLKARVFPCLRYFLSAGDETQFLEELAALLEKLQEIEDIQLFLFLAVDRPFPEFSLILPKLEERRSLIRAVLLARQRSPKDIFQRFLNTSSAEEEEKAAEFDSIDPHALLASLPADFLAPSDFFPLRCLGLLSPFLEHFGLGNLNISPSPHCLLIAIKVPVSAVRLVSFCRIFDVYFLYHELKAILDRADNKIGLFTLKAIQKTFKAALWPRQEFIQEIPDFISLFSDAAKGGESLGARALNRAQFFIIHNKMDIAAFELSRRCECAALQANGRPREHSSEKEPNFLPDGRLDVHENLAAACTGCI